MVHYTLLTFLDNLHFELGHYLNPFRRRQRYSFGLLSVTHARTHGRVLGNIEIDQLVSEPLRGPFTRPVAAPQLFFWSYFQFTRKELNEVRLEKQTGWSTAQDIRAIDSSFHFWAQIDPLQPDLKIQNCVTHIFFDDETNSEHY